MTRSVFEVGDLIENRYRVLSVVGFGGMGTLYRVTDEAQGDQVVALKTVKPGMPGAEVPESVARFQREFRILTQLRHPNLVSVYDYGITTAGQLYFTMEWVPGQDLDPGGRPLAPEAIAPVMVQVCRALAYLHARGVIHGDLKPANVLLMADAASKGQRVKLVDFGVALEMRAPEVRARYYTPHYAAPEIRQLQPVDQRADLYSLGAVWYALLMGEPPPSPGQVFGYERLVRLTLFEALKGQEALGAVVARLLAQAPEDRYASANEVIEAVNEATGSTHALETQETAASYALRVRFVNREAEFAMLQDAWTRARSQVGQVVLVSGENGVGKTRLIEELEVRAELEGARVVWGQCVERGGGAYQPWREVLRVLVRYVEATDEAVMKQAGPVLATLLPALWERDYMAGLTPPAELDPQAAQQRLHDAIVQVLRAASLLRPTMVVIEDAQWADEATLALLDYLSQVSGLAGLLACVTYRDGEVPAGHPLATLAGERVQRIPVRRLSSGATTDLAQAMLGLAELPALLTDRLQLTTKGNAFFVQELIRSLAAGGEVLRRTVDGWQVDHAALREAQLPASIRQVVGQRLAQLPAETRQVLGWAAVTGLVFWEGCVAEVAQVARARVRAALHEALVQGLVTERDDSVFAGEQEILFDSSTVREIAYDAISPEDRRGYHDRVAQWLLARHDDEVEEHLGLIAEHLERGGQGEQAVVYLLRAGDQARLAYAHQEAIDYYQRALPLLKQEEQYGQAARTLMKLGLTHHNAFDFPQSRQAYKEGFTLWQREGDAVHRRAVSLPPAPHALRVISGAESVILEPGLAADSESYAVIDQLFSGLVESSPEMDVVPDVARRWEVHEGGRQYVFTLRDDVHWSDGVPVSAGDFEYAWKRALDPSTGSPSASLLYDVRGARAYHQGEVGDPDQVGVRALDDVTLLVELEEPSSYFPSLLAFAITFAMPRHVVQAYGARWTEPGRIVTCGPFKLARWSHGASMTLERDPTYHGRSSGNLRQVELSFTSDSANVLQTYEADRLDVLFFTYLPQVEWDRAQRRYAGEYVSGPTLLTSYLAFNTIQPPLDEPRVRRALGLAVDRETLADVVMKGHASPAMGGLVPPGMPGYSPGIGLPYDPEGARRSLSEAGYSKAGRDFPTLEAWAWEGSFSVPIVEYLQAQWLENLGVRVIWKPMSLGEMVSRLSSEAPPIHFSAWVADYPDPDSFLRAALWKDHSRWREPAYEDLVEGARRVLDQEERMRMYRQAERILIEESPLLPLLYWRWNLLVKPWVRRYPLSSIKTCFWKDVIIEPH